MAWNAKGGDLSPVVNDQTGRIDFDWDDTGNPIFDDTKAFAVASLITQRRGQWMQDDTGNRGSLVHTVRNDTRAAPSRLENYALDGLQPLVDAGEITGPNGAEQPVAVVTGRPGQRRIDVSYSTPKAGNQTTRGPLS